MIKVPMEFRTPEQEAFFNITMRNSCFSGGFGNGKTTAGCKKIVYLAATFPNYRAAIVRFEESKLKETTMKTFYKDYVCPPALYDPVKGGNRADSINRCKFINNSEIIFMHLKDTDEGMVRGLEVNSVLVDQAEEVSEGMYLFLSGRVGRWDLAEVPQYLLDINPDWPRHNTRYRVPNYMMILCNPDSELHWIYRRYHPDSEDWQNKYKSNHVMVQGETTTLTVEDENLEEMLQNDTAWVQRFVKGKWGIPGGQIHQVHDSSILEVGKDINPEFVQSIIERGHLCRVLDHGDSAPTCCLWFSAYKGNYYCYREYYKPNALISEHRKTISELSRFSTQNNEYRDEVYLYNIIDPQCAKKTMQKYGGRWSQVDEYADKSIDAPPLYWEPADNNELSTRNRISELLRLSQTNEHPILHTKPAPRLYFIKRSESYPNGAYFAIQQLKAQKREKVSTINGQDIYSDDRDKNVSDHAYDCVRYYSASHAVSPSPTRPKVPEGSFFNVRKELIALRKYGYSRMFGQNLEIKNV